jgi:hypothetical protein
MDAVSKQSRETQVVIGGTALFIILSFFHWQSFKIELFGQSIGAAWTLWHGLGTVAALIAIALLVVELIRLAQVKVEFGEVHAGHASIVLATLLAVFTVIKFLQANEGRVWPAWVGLILSIVVAVAAWKRSNDEGLRVPDMATVRPAPQAAGSGPESTATTPPSEPTRTTQSDDQPPTA